MNGIEHLTANEQIAYPFDEDSAALLDGRILLNSMADINFEGPYPDVVLWSVRRDGVSVILNFATPGGAHLLSPVLPVAAGLYEIFNADRPEIRASVSILTGSGWAAWAADLADNVELLVEAKLAAGAVSPEPLCLQDFLIGAQGTVDSSGLLRLVQGFNLQVAVDTVDGISTLTLSANAGAGDGRDNDCTARCEIHDLRTINHQRPDALGNINLSSGGCYGFLAGAAQIGLGNHCTPCCTCKDYGDVAGKINDVGAGISDLHADYLRALQQYRDMVDDFVNNILPRYRVVKIACHSQQRSVFIAVTATFTDFQLDPGFDAEVELNDPAYELVDSSVAYGPETPCRSVVITNLYRFVESDRDPATVEFSEENDEHVSIGTGEVTSAPSTPAPAPVAGALVLSATSTTSNTVYSARYTVGVSTPLP